MEKKNNQFIVVLVRLGTCYQMPKAYWKQRVHVIVWQRFCELARLRIAYYLSLLPDLVRHLMFTGLYQNPGKSVNWILLVISIPLCQTSCPLRTVHCKNNFVA